MKKVLLAIGTSNFDLHDLCDALKERGVECTIRHWNGISDPPGHYDLAVLFGLTEYRVVAEKYASTVREAIGKETTFLIVSTWDPAGMAHPMKEKYDAQYLRRHEPIRNLLAAVLEMLDEAKTAPC